MPRKHDNIFPQRKSILFSCNDWIPTMTTTISSMWSAKVNLQFPTKKFTALKESHDFAFGVRSLSTHRIPVFFGGYEHSRQKRIQQQQQHVNNNMSTTTTPTTTTTTTTATATATTTSTAKAACATERLFLTTYRDKSSAMQIKMIGEKQHLDLKYLKETPFTTIISILRVSAFAVRRDTRTIECRSDEFHDPLQESTCGHRWHTSCTLKMIGSKW